MTQMKFNWLFQCCKNNLTNATDEAKIHGSIYAWFVYLIELKMIIKDGVYQWKNISSS